MIEVTDDQVAVGHIFIDSFEQSQHESGQENIFAIKLCFFYHPINQKHCDSIHDSLILLLSLFQLQIQIQAFLDESIALDVTLAFLVAFDVHSHEGVERLLLRIPDDLIVGHVIEYFEKEGKALLLLFVF